MRAITAAVVATLLASLAHAEDADERYLLGDYGVRLDLTEEWSPQEWSDAAFEAQTSDQQLKLYAWGTPIQVPLREDDLEAWGKVFTDKVARFGGKDVQVTSAALTTVGAHQAARFAVSFAYRKDMKGVLSGVTLPVQGRMFHLAVVTAASRSLQASMAVEQLFERAEVRRPAAPVTPHATVRGAGVEVTLPDGWRAPLDAEFGELTALARPLGLEDLTMCLSALRPEANDAPDVLITCQAGMLLGVVDEHSFAGVDATLREKLFPGVEVPPAEPVIAADGRLAFLYRPQVSGRTLRIGVVPYGDGVARTWVFGDDEGDDKAFDIALEHVLTTATFTGDHPVGVGDQVSYYWTYRKSSPVVWGPLLALVLGAGGLGWSLSRRAKTAFEDGPET